MPATKANPIVFFDIASKAGPWSPNTWKTRLALIHKRLPYRVEYVSYPDIESTFKRFGVPATSDKAPQYTLPMIADPSDDPDGKPTYIADSFKIALYLDDKYPSPTYPALFPPGTRALQRVFAERVSALIQPMAPTMLPLVGRSGFLDDRGEEYYRRTRQARFGKSLEQLADEGRQSWGQVRETWDAFGRLIDINEEPNEAVPFVMESQISYADLLLVAVFCWVKRAENSDKGLWEEMSQWQGGRWKNLWEAVEKAVGKFYEEV
ncbi:glutathione transferase, putative [Rhizoctonia solani AG-3 Rhs1AP]|uniref:Glutathione S-transferase, amino-terminal domain protein n=2 Tax=Rhizoctonia solani AG-3 TaxID=1086053 RepID=A0A074RSS9_9AGAM|nr:glutathione transferase, putative [Rhizoctonia solani AG-3 Rhs1AP]KEP49929.1 glutathione S-transferase, amino-terminal domain protein [Rhizoctonia solani 123E]